MKTKVQQSKSWWFLKDRVPYQGAVTVYRTIYSEQFIVQLSSIIQQSFETVIIEIHQQCSMEVSSIFGLWWQTGATRCVPAAGGTQVHTRVLERRVLLNCFSHLWGTLSFSRYWYCIWGCVLVFQTILCVFCGHGEDICSITSGFLVGDAIGECDMKPIVASYLIPVQL